jgi:hypothetical protein
MSTHVIRLRGHWARDVLPDGRVRLARNFGRPRTLAANETAWIVGACADGVALLNGEPLGPVLDGLPFAFDVTTRLAPRNTIALEVTEAGEVDIWLEVRSML